MNNRLGALPGVQAGHQLDGDIFPLVQQTLALLRALGNLRWIGPEEEGSNRDYFIAPDAEVQGNVMALDAPSPGIAAAGLAEHGPIIELRIPVPSHASRIFFQRTKYQLMLHDTLGALVGG